VSPGVSRTSGALRGLLIAGSIGLTASAIAIISDANTEEDVIIPSSVYVVPTAVALTAVGTAIGALIGKRKWNSEQTRRAGAEP
jgi:hypothetical protein